ncbi:MAG: hypothetical protein HYR56_06820 [Acidobacteria bacterium]|nr:hypothetical protein [Acidobacteriota bacterium]MBI3426801.1 hypothetical protein [Acidobacteriota bacterium]
MNVSLRCSQFLFYGALLASPLFCAAAVRAAGLGDGQQVAPQTDGVKATPPDFRATLGTASNQPAQVNAANLGSVLLFPVYTSSSAAPQQQNTRFSLTNVAETTAVNVHLFFVDGVTGRSADAWICLTAQQTVSLLASDVDPGVNGYVVAVATDARGCPLHFNFLAGEAAVKFASGHAANLAAVAIAALDGAAVCVGVTATLRFDGVKFSALPRVLAVSNFPSRADGNDTFVLVDRIGGDLTGSAVSIGTLFGVVYDDAESPFSFSSLSQSAQLRINFRCQFPARCPFLTQYIPAGRSGWLKLYNLTQDVALLGALFNFNPFLQAGSFSQGHNLHALSLTNSVVLTIPVFPPTC